MSTRRRSAPASFALGRRVEGDGAGVRALFAANDLRADALAPDLELLHGRCAERVARGEDHLLAVGAVRASRACRSSSSCRRR